MNRPRFRTYRHKRETQSAHLITRLEKSIPHRDRADATRGLGTIELMMQIRKPGPQAEGPTVTAQAQAVDRAIAAPSSRPGYGQRAKWTVYRPAKQPRPVWYRRLLNPLADVSQQAWMSRVYLVSRMQLRKGATQGSCRGAAWIGAMETPSAKKPVRLRDTGSCRSYRRRRATHPMPAWPSRAAEPC